MTLDEAIEHCEEKSQCGTACGMEHKQLAEWLRELKVFRSNIKENELTKDDYILLLEKELEIYKAKCAGQAEQLKELEAKYNLIKSNYNTLMEVLANNTNKPKCNTGFL